MYVKALRSVKLSKAFMFMVCFAFKKSSNIHHLFFLFTFHPFR